VRKEEVEEKGIARGRVQWVDDDDVFYLFFATMSQPLTLSLILNTAVLAATSQTLLFRPSKQPLMVRTFLKVYVELCSSFLFLQEQIKDIISIISNR
jgi:hypothetical protein